MANVTPVRDLIDAQLKRGHASAFDSKPKSNPKTRTLGDECGKIRQQIMTTLTGMSGSGVSISVERDPTTRHPTNNLRVTLARQLVDRAPHVFVVSIAPTPDTVEKAETIRQKVEEDIKTLQERIAKARASNQEEFEKAKEEKRKPVYSEVPTLKEPAPVEEKFIISVYGHPIFASSTMPSGDVKAKALAQTEPAELMTISLTRTPMDGGGISTEFKVIQPPFMVRSTNQKLSIVPHIKKFFDTVRDTLDKHGSTLRQITASAVMHEQLECLLKGQKYVAPAAAAPGNSPPSASTEICSNGESPQTKYQPLSFNDRMRRLMASSKDNKDSVSTPIDESPPASADSPQQKGEEPSRAKPEESKVSNVLVSSNSSGFRL